MVKKYILILASILILFSVGCSQETQNDNKINIAVSIVPEETFVKKVAGDLVDVITLIPPGNSPANYQPSTKEMMELSDAKIYFSIGVEAEKANILPKVKDFNEDVKIIDLQQLIGDNDLLNYFDDEKTSVDPHIWLSPQRVIIMVEKIAEELSLIDPDNKEVYLINSKDYIAELTKIDEEIKNNLSEFIGETFLIYHGAYGYFASDYNINMLAVEEQGKPSSVQEMQSIIDFAKENGYKYIFYQAEFSDTQAQTIAKEINGKAIKVDPLSANYIESLNNVVSEIIGD